MEFITLICPNLKCRKTLQVPESVRGKIVKCGYCMSTFSVPLRREPAAAINSPTPGGPEHPQTT
jgi:hypothetical protein